MTTLYIAGPMRGIPEFNFRAFTQADVELGAVGYGTIDPAERDMSNGFNPRGMTGNEDLAELGFDLKEALAWDLDQIAKNADGIAVLPGWQSSKGAAAEIATARALGLPVATVEEWLRVATPEVGDMVSGEGVVSGRLYERALLLKDEATTMADERLVLVDSRELYVAKDSVKLVEKATPLRDIAESAIEENAQEATPVTPLAGEVRVVSETGGEKGRKPAELATVDPLALLTLAEVSGFGAQKYAAFNYLRGYDWSLSMNALMRHVLAFWNGEDLDPESGKPHMGHAAWHALALVSFLQRGLGTDDRFKQEGVAA